ncbi:DUF2971 domain-containing protein [Paludibaculum fermentans]|uniref:DUF2971 domain-containing protein n=1 Tax=Paludibaculum fermentans TaxID=1473598 RepID=UPI003EBC2C30
MAAEPSIEVRGSIDMNALRGFLGMVGSAVGPDLILNPGKNLFHYADLNGLLGIIQNGDLWLTHSRYSNDEEEMARGQRVAMEAVDSALKESKLAASKKEYLTKLQALIAKPSLEGVYICCFCQKDNLLSQWRGYGAMGAGVSIQFDSSKFGDWTGADCPYGLMRFWKVLYNAERQRRIIDSAIKFSWNPALPPAKGAQRAADAIQFFIPTFKNADFEEESEWRFIFTPNPQCKVVPQFRARGSMLVPYYRLRDLVVQPLKKKPAVPPRLPICHVTVGPSADKALNVVSVKMLLDQYGYTQVPVDASMTSFRG